MHKTAEEATGIVDRALEPSETLSKTQRDGKFLGEGVYKAKGHHAILSVQTSRLNCCHGHTNHSLNIHVPHHMP